PQPSLSSLSLLLPAPPSTLLPYTTLFRSSSADLVIESPGSVVGMYMIVPSLRLGMNSEPSLDAGQTLPASTNKAKAIVRPLAFRDRKSTRLNSSHVKISYAVFCLKKKNLN